ncbi:MAG TPA: DUF2218 domain-containing protein [Streptosporangiaceae bacterium]
MLTAEARVETERASRYLTQVCQHVQSIYSKRGPLSHGRRRRLAGHAQGRPAEPPRVERTGTLGTVSFGDAAITLKADPGALILRAEAGGEESLQHAQELVTGLLARFGRRDRLTVAWHRAGAAA